jgi:hypothetical protein
VRRAHGPRASDGGKAHLGDFAALGVDLIETVAYGDDVRIRGLSLCFLGVPRGIRTYA